MMDKPPGPGYVSDVSVVVRERLLTDGAVFALKHRVTPEFDCDMLMQD